MQEEELKSVSNHKAIKPNELTIGSIIRTNRGEVIRVESISTKRQHRKVGYHRPDDPYHIHYVRLAVCEGIPVTRELLEANGWVLARSFPYVDIYCIPFRAQLELYCNEKDHTLTGDVRVSGAQQKYFKSSLHNVQMALIAGGCPEVADWFKTII